MNYQKLYDSIVTRAQTEMRSKKLSYFESHHILPKSLGGSDKVYNRVLLTPREHFICHYLLVKIHKNGPGYVKMCRAFSMMRAKHNKHQRYINARLYEQIKKELYGPGGVLTGINASGYGVKLSEEAKAQISLRQTTHNSMKGKSPWNKGLTKETDLRVRQYGEKSKGKTVVISEETKAKISASLMGRTKTPRTQEHRRKLSESTKKFVKTQEQIEYNKLRTSQTHKGVPKPKICCPHCKKEGGEGAMIRWHFNNCKERK